MLHDEVWLAATNSPGGMLCIGCVEARLGRELKAADFHDSPINLSPPWPRSERFLDRLG